MTRGNQRELARAKNLKKQDKKGPKDDGLTVEQRRLRDAEALREKQKKKADTTQNSSAGNSSKTA